MVEKRNIEHAIKDEAVIKNRVKRTFPGIDSITASIVLGKIGDIRRFQNAEKLVAFFRIDPVIKESEKLRSQRLSISLRGYSLLRFTIYISTVSAVRMNRVTHEYYHRKIERGMPRKKTLVASSMKQCHIIWSVWHNNRPFDISEEFRKDRE